MPSLLNNLHFKTDYQAMVRELIANYPIDEAMSLAVGGDYEQSGRIQEAVLRMFDVDQVGSMIDLGCGSGRLASRLAHSYRGDFLGIDVVKEMLDYADARTPENFRFAEVSSIGIPAADASADVVTAFSLFTHLLHEETFLYLQEVKRVLRPGGRLIFSFLEFGAANHWPVFVDSVCAYKSGKLKHLNTFIERFAIQAWATMLGFTVERIINGWDCVIPIEAPVRFANGVVREKLCEFGQSIAVYRNPSS